jgi:Cu(I)/Ag(I) efflux system membrane protein CusA/SilA
MLVSGMVRQYQVVLDPRQTGAVQHPHTRVIDALQSQPEPVAPVLELGEAGMVRASGYLTSLDDFRKIPLTTNRG